MEVAFAPTAQIWDKGTSIVIVFVVTALVAYVTIHNRIAVFVGSFLALMLALYVNQLAASIEYASFRTQLSLLAKFTTTSATILLLTVFSRVFSEFVSESGNLTIETLDRIIVIFVLVISLYSILHKYMWLYQSKLK